ncbi:MAG TPA: hypothetical protein VFQ68_00920 [Streptosporangiaceae bacterium]|nr:hypothetical protein [Streptosporangiaceae bacterium]
MVAVTRDFADDLAEVARLLSENEVAVAAGFGSLEAFRLLSRYSQNTNQRVRVISSRLVRDRMAAAAFRPAGER